ncbi:hypothetical protein E4U58_003279 [Claviceps cyperi]|nr:hypothetical protein E4U58_003279 [Claviceps cyperi]
MLLPHQLAAATNDHSQDSRLKTQDSKSLKPLPRDSRSPPHPSQDLTRANQIPSIKPIPLPPESASSRKRRYTSNHTTHEAASTNLVRPTRAGRERERVRKNPQP